MASRTQWTVASILTVALAATAASSPSVNAVADTVLTPAIGAVDVDPVADLVVAFDEPVQSGAGDITVYRGSHQQLFTDPLDDLSLVTVTTGSFFADDDLAFAPDAIFGRNDGAGGGDFGGDTPADRVNYNGFAGGFIEANGLPFGGANPVVVEWTGIDITGADDLEFGVDLASALQPDTSDFVLFEANIDGAGYVQLLEVTSATLDGVFATSDLGETLTDTAQNFRRAIPGNGSTLDIRATLRLSGTGSTGDDIAIDNVTVSGGGVGSSVEVERLAVGSGNISFVSDQVIIDPTADLDENTGYYVVVRPGAVTDQAPSPNPYRGILSGVWNFTTGELSQPPTFAKEFAPDSILATQLSTMTFTIDNAANTRSTTGLAFTDDLPDGMVIATPADAATTCTGGTLTAVDGSGTLSYSGGAVAPGASCTITVDVTTDTLTVGGALVNTTGDLTSAAGNSGPATDTLTVTALTPPTVTIDQAAGQDDPTAEPTVVYTVVFSEDVTGFELSDVSVTNGTATGLVATTPNRVYEVTVDADDGDVTATIPAGAADDIDGTPSVASTSTDNLVRVDTGDPVIQTPDTITVPNDPGTAGAVVDYEVTASDDVSCTPVSGSTFPIGTTTVTCTARDAAGNSTTAAFDVIVTDGDDPVITQPTSMSFSGGPGPIDYVVPTATDNSGAELDVTCSPPPGSVFPVGTTTVTCTASDDAGNTTSVVFTISIASTILPETGGGLGGVTIAAQLLLIGVLLVAVARTRRRPV